ncbi:hypothetical protein HHI36_008153 [Cryptolaemus montrouzieri]|uniref:Endonuclease/exonuclease/phosphatase domain-containing protein n=1 Tax=Cryptolaemus montrouzieri TaxID=559131 RepID=A0ABD2MRQ1_9CUCU
MTKLAKEKDKSKGEMKIENDEEHLKQTKHKKRENQTIEKKDQIYLGTWNVRTTYVEGTLIRLTEIMEKYEIDILALQETKQLGNFVEEVGNYIFFNSGGEDRRLGTGFLINRSLKQEIVEFLPITNRLCKIRVRSKYRKLTLMNVHCPTEEKENEIKEKFYEMIEEEYDKTPKFDVKIILGDFNAKLGQEEIYRPAIGKYSKHEESNENGKKLIELATERNLRVVTTYFQHKDIYKGTWISPDNRTVNQIDHMVIESKHAKYIMNVRSLRGADVDIDHMLVRAKIKYRKPEHQESKRNKVIKYAVEKLNDENIRKEFQTKINKRISSNKEESVEDQWRQLEQMMKEGADMLLKDDSKADQGGWYDEECRRAVLEREESRMNMMKNNTKENQKLYREKRRKAKSTCRRKKREYIETEMENLENNYMRKQTRQFYKNIQYQRRLYQQNKILFCKDKNGQLVEGIEESLKRWSEYFRELLDGKSEETSENANDEGAFLNEAY